MGCCQSNNANRTSSSDVAAVPHPQSQNQGSYSYNPTTNAATSAHAVLSGLSASIPHSRPNARIRAPSPIARSPRNVSPQQPPWTRSHLERQRQIFFETRVAGRKEVWDVVRAAADALVRGQLAEAQALLDAGCVTCPTGRVAKGRAKSDRERGGVYDDRGRLYEVPEWVLRDPDDIVEDGKGTGLDGSHSEDRIFGTTGDDEGMDEEKEDGKEINDGSGMIGEDTEAGNDRLADGKQLRALPKIAAQGEKGKGRALDLGEMQRVRVRLSTGANDVEVNLGTLQRVAVLHRLLRARVLGDQAQVRVFYLGRVLDPSKTLLEQGWKAGDVLSALVRIEPQQQQQE
ncbi:uncharacterized protein K489DRAFT_376950 [Dissoconium aciculare CBS 342.82]|uniref:Ubiquitin-like domain-containing protein n=1 Tax=Dissoconium aciculare CBS 342.82 TaxID=1314786 RepID=A0A6J3MFA6_9PEZI|nr:uncharacterized protein K489DRAFT_376950 [Dissoconium aciculare CBS 342.82]KAF1826528.1 hypothetical protein K489DRAFT_376950 [Dissoconium aciculare CBS 342.82]